MREDIWTQGPKHYSELLSDEQANQHAATWLRAWEKIVFGKTNATIISLQAKTVDFEERSFYEPVKLLASTRPVKPVLMLSGPAGCGKTTLARILARTYGYDVSEVNASDDRSASILKQKISDVITNNSRMLQAFATKKKKAKPQLLLLDEIDGADGSNAVNELLKYLKPGKPTKKGKVRHMPVQRPIICICNEPYIPALRELRQQAMHVAVPAISPKVLVGRVQEMARRRGIDLQFTAAKALCQVSNNDVRSALMALQYLAAEGGTVTADRIASLPIVSNTKPSLMAAARLIMCRADPHGDTGRMPLPGVLRAARSLKDAEFVHRALEEHWLDIPFPDSPDLAGAVAVADTLSLIDTVRAAIPSTMDQTLRRNESLPTAVYSTVLHVRPDGLTGKSIFPRQDVDARRTHKTLTAALASARLTVPSSLAPYRPGAEFRATAIPLLMKMTEMPRVLAAGDVERAAVLGRVRAAMAGCGVRGVAAGQGCVTFSVPTTLEEFPMAGLKIKPPDPEVAAALTVAEEDGAKVKNITKRPAAVKRRKAPVDSFTRIFTERATGAHIKTAIPEVYYEFYEGVTMAVRLKPGLEAFV